MKYQLICSESVEVFEDQVNKAITLGWKPQGGVAIFVEKGNDRSDVITFSQAMVR